MANESTEKEVEVNNEIVESQETESSSDTKVWDDKYPKWQKMLPKEYWGSEKLSKYDSLTAVINDATNPKKKAPEKYSLNVNNAEFGNKLEEAFKKADVASADANEILNLFNANTPKIYTEDDARDTFGMADYEVIKANKENAIYKICGTNEKLKEDIKKSNFYNDPSFVRFADIVGKNLGKGNVEDFTNEKLPEHRDVWEEMISGARKEK